MLQIKDNSGTLQTIRHGLDIGGEWRDARTTPALAAGGATKLQFGTQVVTPNGITFNGTDTFTGVTLGSYDIFVQLRASTAVNGGICMGATTYADGTHKIPFLGFTGGPDYGLSGNYTISPAETFSFWFYNNGAATTINNALRNAICRIWLRRGPK